jgi:oligopeptide transport system substrate-binding protein
MGNSAKSQSPLRGRKVGLDGRLRLIVKVLAAFGFLATLSCTQLNKPEPEPFFAETSPPKVQEFRWSNGQLPKSFDPALAAAPPETDVVRALYEGLTETDPTTLQEIPGVAESWAASADFRTWTFRLRPDAKWSNGKPVTAIDFVRAWTRLIKLGDKTAHRSLLSNIVGVPRKKADAAATEEAELLLRSNSNQAPVQPLQQLGQLPANANEKATERQTRAANANTASPGSGVPAGDPPAVGIEAVDDITLKVTLTVADSEFPKLVAHPIFRPVFNNGEEFIGKELNPGIVTNGPFRLAAIEASGLVLERSENYWNREKVLLERVRIVPMESSEKALAAYRAGELDAITNASLSPLVMKLLTPYEDFRKTTHSALNFYEVNTNKAPFSDRRVREALSNAIDRERLTEGEMDGLTRPALSFLAFRTDTKTKLTQDKEKARDLFEEAGYPEGDGFPVIMLVVNRNDTQQRIARSVARMWKQNLNVETEIVVKEAVELEQARKDGDFDLVRRGVVFPTSDETANFLEVFGGQGISAPDPGAPGTPEYRRLPTPTPENVPGNRETYILPGFGPSPTPAADPPILTEDEALYQLRAIPLYFPTSFSLVKPYVAGFETNSLDILNLAGVTINSEWRPEAK